MTGYVIDADIWVYRGDDWGPMVVQVCDQAVAADGTPLWDDAAQTIPTLGEPLNLTDATVLAQIRKDAKPTTPILGAFVTEVLDQASPDTRGCFSLELTSDVTGALLPTTTTPLRYDAQVTRAGRKRTYVRGAVTVEGDVSREESREEAAP